MSNSFRELFDSVAPGLLRYVRRLSGSRSDAEEIVQETFLKLHVRLSEESDALLTARAWLFRVATNAARDLDRERRVRARDTHRSPGDRVVEMEIHLERRQITRRALGKLPPRMRLVLLLWSEGFTYREISDIAAIEPGYVGVLLQRARAAFRKEFEELGSGAAGRTHHGLL